MIIGEWPEFKKILDKIYDSEFGEYIFGDPDSHMGHEWYITGEAAQAGKNLNLLSWEFSKEIDGVVHVVNMTNSYEYAGVGEDWWVIHSQTSDPTGVEQFRTDFEFDKYIDEIDSVNQTL